MHWAPLAVSFALALALVPSGVRGLERAGRRRQNFRERQVAYPLGAVLLATSLVALAPLALLDGRAGLHLIEPDFRRWVAYVLGVALLGLIDDTIGRGAAADSPRGWRGHARAALHGELSAGAVKAAGALGLAAFVVSGRGRHELDYLADLALLLLTTNLFNLLDLRPGRAEKALVLLGAGLCIGGATLLPVRLMGLFLGPLLVGGWFTLRERAMLGDAGSNLAGAVAGVWLLTSLGHSGRLIALATVALLTVYGEFRSLSAAIDRVPLLRHLDSLGRAS
jgi:UDP-GlcNAc:undecaprenyl-phosphate GlcNAc-1-phosphate transferase